MCTQKTTTHSAGNHEDMRPGITERIIGMSAAERSVGARGTRELPEALSSRPQIRSMVFNAPSALQGRFSRTRTDFEGPDIPNAAAVFLSHFHARRPPDSCPSRGPFSSPLLVLGSTRSVPNAALNLHVFPIAYLRVRNCMCAARSEGQRADSTPLSTTRRVLRRRCNSTRKRCTTLVLLVCSRGAAGSVRPAMCARRIAEHVANAGVEVRTPRGPRQGLTWTVHG
ncbi:hypothetical protein DFH09DRAFT_1082447 [Mycena vulgaris]|nr:hypothetical protein DFH09DRAFT_1082447 [Mycena vulgaris]